MSILSYVDDNIGNIDLTKNYVYVLELEDERYYVGRTSNFFQRIEDHFNGNGSIYTKKYKPIKIKEVIEETNLYIERDKKIEYMNLYGYEKVRGYAWCREILRKQPKITNKKPSINVKKNYDENPVIKEMYILENKDIIEIGNYLNKSPGSIAYSLECMGIVERRQLSKGYFEYIFSNLYKKSKMDNEEKRLEKREKKINMKKEITFTEEELKNIKKRIIEKFYENKL